MNTKTTEICPKCGAIASYDPYFHAFICSKSNCDYLRRIKSTNADRIRVMTDEELAHFISEIADCCVCKAEMGKGCSAGKKCEDFWLDWVKQEVEI